MYNTALHLPTMWVLHALCCVDIYQDLHVTTNKVDFNMEILINITLKQTRRSYVLLYDHFFFTKKYQKWCARSNINISARAAHPKSDRLQYFAFTCKLYVPL